MWPATSEQEQLAHEHARFIINGRTERGVVEAIRWIRSAVPNARLEALAFDPSKAEASQETTSKFPDVQILVNNLSKYEPKPFEEIVDADWTDIIETNFMSGVRLARHYLPLMKKGEWGRIIFISSESGVKYRSK